MARWDKCLYASAYSSLAALSLAVQQIHDQTAKVLDGRLEGDNLNPSMFGAGIILAPNPPNPPPPPPPQPTPTPNKRQRLYPLGDYPGRFQIKVPLADRDTMAFMQKKGGDFQREDLKPGIEFVVDATDATNGRVCVVGRSNTDKQIISLIPEDPATVANPSGKVYTNYGKAIFGSSAAHDWELHRNGAASLSDNGTSLATNRKLDLTGGTAYRTRIDPGTPTADKTTTLPNRTGNIVLAPSALTSAQLLKADANGDAVTAGDAAAVRSLIGAGTSSVANLDDLGDVSTSGAADGDMLVYNSGSWAPVAPGAASTDCVSAKVYMVNGSANQSLTNNTVTDVEFDTTKYDDLGGTLAEPTYTLPSAGKYRIHGQIALDYQGAAATADLAYIEIYDSTNATILARSYYGGLTLTAGGYPVTMSVESTESVASGIDVKIRVFFKEGTSAATDILYGLENTYLDISKIGPAA